jgi:hypothetical protein
MVSRHGKNQAGVTRLGSLIAALFERPPVQVFCFVTTSSGVTASGGAIRHGDNASAKTSDGDGNVHQSRSIPRLAFSVR